MPRLSQRHIFLLSELFPVERFWNSAFGLAHTLLGYHQAKMEAVDPQKLSEIVRESQTATAQILQGYLQINANLSIPFTRLAGDRLISTLQDENCTMTLRETLDAADEVFNRLWDELEQGGHFFYIPIDRAESYDLKEPFGAKVSSKFPKLTEDIEEAHKCYACGRYTACVFHLMRIMEHGVQRLGRKLNISNAQNLVWQVILDQVNKAISQMPSTNRKKKKYAEIASHLYNVKLAWRNEVMHPKATYTEDEAKGLLSQICRFMQTLAEVV